MDRNIRSRSPATIKLAQIAFSAVLISWASATAHADEASWKSMKSDEFDGMAYFVKVPPDWKVKIDTSNGIRILPPPLTDLGVRTPLVPEQVTPATDIKQRYKSRRRNHTKTTLALRGL